VWRRSSSPSHSPVTNPSLDRICMDPPECLAPFHDSHSPEFMADDSGGSGGASPLVVGIVAVLAAAIAGAASFGAAYLAFASKDQELKVHLVEIAIGILRADPKEDVAPARGWALDVIEKNSRVPFSPQDREALLHKPLSIPTALLGIGAGPGVGAGRIN